MSNVRLLQWRQTIPEHQWVMLERGGHTDSYLRSTARQALADKLVRESAVQERHIEPDPESPWPGPDRRVITWSVGVTDPADTEAFANQLEAARIEGMNEAAKIVAENATRYAGADGHCGPVIASALWRAARAVEEAAARAAKSSEVQRLSSGRRPEDRLAQDEP